MDILKIDYKAADAAVRLAKSLKETGFAVLENHPLNPQELIDLRIAWDQFFASDAKMNFHFEKDQETFLGYYPYNLEKAKGYNTANLMEYYHYNLNDKNALPADLLAKTKHVFAQGYEIAKQLCTWLDEQTPADIKKDFECSLQDAIKDSETSIMRIIHYPALQGNEEQGAIRAAEHEDIDFLTVLPAANRPGLQAKDIEGNWHSIDTNPGNIVINAGDMLQMITKGYYKSTTHRVINPTSQAENKPRFSTPMFFQARNNVRLSETYTAKEYLRERFKENNILKK